ncbi:FAD synthetase, putative [Plasmodium gallinaceum]|uniref:FAD synthase n=1 Tax=Plasmodium gallinaceum TaxID=5849 RepID=A0A1J1GSB9_PLAGA|nr:FAD synthetase, putative [Plasmodium gallinaceum]CRG94208.1 FAD synthetase, putative [Plasmodium gallinaceum]
MDIEDNEEWNDYSNSLKFYEKIEKLYYEHMKEANKIKDCNKEISNPNILKDDNEVKSNIRGGNNNIIKPSMYNYDVINYYKDEVNLKKKAIELSEDIMEAIDYIYDIFRLCKKNVFLSFNGGKDAVVTLHLFRCAYARYIKDIKGKRKKPNLIYFKDEINEFPEVYQFINECAYMHDFNIIIIKGTWKNGVTHFIENFHKMYENDFLNQVKIPNIDPVSFYPTIAFINGTRYNDSYSEKLHILNISSRNFPPYLYLNPIFYWTYGAIWTFILYFKFNYCILYNHGYSSIGSMNDTVKNEFLKCNDCYLPAYFLKNWDYERYNRVSTKEK